MLQRYAAIAVCGALAACGSEPDDAYVGDPLQIITGDGQTIVQHATTAPLGVLAVDTNGNALIGALVAFESATDSDFLFSETVATNQNGQALRGPYDSHRR